MTYPAKSFEADEERERWLEETIEVEKRIREDDKELQKIKERLESSIKEGKEFLKEHNLTEEEVMEGKRIVDSGK